MSYIHPDDLADMMGDGYSNEHQRAFAVAQMMLKRTNDKQRGEELARAGRVVIMVEVERHCPFTDAFIGVDNCLYGDYATHDEANAIMRRHQDNAHDDCGFRILSLDTFKERQQDELLHAYVLAHPVIDDIPF